MLLRDDTLLSLQFQALLKAFKSETLSFEALLAGAGRGTPAAKRMALMCSAAAEVVTVLHAERDPALFALWGAFVPPHHQVRPTTCLRGTLVALTALLRSHATGAVVPTQSQYQARLLSLQTQHAQRAPAAQKPAQLPALSELPGLRRERDELGDAGNGGKLQRFSRGPCLPSLASPRSLAPAPDAAASAPQMPLPRMHPRIESVTTLAPAHSAPPVRPFYLSCQFAG
jgi:hypothetical protein